MIKLVRYGGLLILVFYQRLSPSNAPYKIGDRTTRSGDLTLSKLMIAFRNLELRMKYKAIALQCLRLIEYQFFCFIF